MGLTPEKQHVLEHLNRQIDAAHKDETERATRAGKVAPVKPPHLTEAHIEFPKWLHKGVKAEAKVHSLHVPADSILVKSAEEMKEALADGYSEEPRKAEPSKKDAAKEK